MFIRAFITWFEVHYNVDVDNQRLIDKADSQVYQAWDVIGDSNSTRSKKATRKDLYRRAATVGEQSEHVCRNFDGGGSNQYYRTKTCRDCGKVFKEKISPAVEDPETCLHVNINNSGSSK